nr:hypothetical protein [Tanacetum cinerariifolium]
MENLPIANEFVRGLEGFRTRRTSVTSFRQGLQAIRDDHMRARNLEDQVVEVEEMNRAYSDVLFAFRRCLMVGMTERTITRRARRHGFPIWPPSSDAHSLMVAIQFWYGLHVAREIVRIPRQTNFADLWWMIRHLRFGILGREAGLITLLLVNEWVYDIYDFVKRLE